MTEEHRAPQLADVSPVREHIERQLMPDPERFSPLEQWLGAYDRGEYCYQPEISWFRHAFGHAFIPAHYVRERWAKHFAAGQAVRGVRRERKAVAAYKSLWMVLALRSGRVREPPGEPRQTRGPTRAVLRGGR